MRLSKVFVYGLLMNQFENGASVSGQLIKVNTQTLKMLDKVESKGRFYDRIKVDIWVGGKYACREVKNVWAYQQMEDIRNDKKAK
jgi:gamma-glutamylcyclotransferase (GGCT)/AIG2-like uncharacterized protein YtfP